MFVRLVVVIVVAVLAVLAGGARAAPPTADERTEALATVVAVYNNASADAQKALAVPVAMLVNDTAGIAYGKPPTAEQQQALTDLLVALRTRGVDAMPAVHASVAQFSTFLCKSRQSQAKAALRSLHVAEESYRAEFDTYSPITASLGYDESLNKLYKVDMTSVQAASYAARAVGRDAMAGDEWKIDEKGMPAATTDLCAKIAPEPVKDPLPTPPSPSDEARAKAFAILSRVPPRAPSTPSTPDPRAPDDPARMSLRALVMHAAGIDDPRDVEKLDDKKLKALEAAVKKQGGDLTAALEPIYRDRRVMACLKLQRPMMLALEAIATAQRESEDQTGAFRTDLKALVAKQKVPGFALKVVKGAKDGYEVTATGSGKSKGDRWKLTHTGIVPVDDLCSKVK